MRFQTKFRVLLLLIQILQNILFNIYCTLKLRNIQWDVTGIWIDF